MKIIQVILISLIISSCTKTNKDSLLPPEFNIVKSLSGQSLNTVGNGPYDNYVIITTSQTANSLDRVNSYNISVNAKFTDANGSVVNTGPVVIGNRVIQAGADNYYEYKYKDSTFAEGKALLGSNNVPVTATGGGSGVPAPVAGIIRPRRIMTVLKDIFPSTGPIPGNLVDRGFSFPLNWSADPNNQFQKVNIEISYKKGISKYNAPNMPNAIPHLVYQVADNGSFTIPAADLAIFPRGAYIEISISRAYLDYVSGDVAYLSVTEAHTIPLLVVDKGPLSVDIGVSLYPQSAICSALVNGGVPPFTYEWRIHIYSTGTWGNILSTSPTINFNWGCLTAPQTSEIFKLTVTDALGNIQSREKYVTHRCLRS